MNDYREPVGLGRAGCDYRSELGLKLILGLAKIDAFVISY